MKWPLAICFLLASCGYHLAQPTAFNQVAVPYVKGDVSGQFTNDLMRELEMRGYLDHSHKAPLTLHATVIRDDREEIGYRYDRKGTNADRISRLRPTESKRIIEVEVILRDASGKKVYGPETVTSSVDYDYVNFDTVSDLAVGPLAAPTTSVLAFSLGQLDAIEGAQTAALDPLYRKLAALIADGLPLETIGRAQ